MVARLDRSGVLRYRSLLHGSQHLRVLEPGCRIGKDFHLIPVPYSPGVCLPHSCCLERIHHPLHQNAPKRQERSGSRRKTRNLMFGEKGRLERQEEPEESEEILGFVVSREAEE